MALRYVTVGQLDQIPPGSAKGARPWPGCRLALCNVNGTIFALDDVCTHAGGIMHYGDVKGELIRCPVHLATFNIMSGEYVDGPTCGSIRTYPVRMRGNNIEVGIEE